MMQDLEGQKGLIKEEKQAIQSLFKEDQDGLDNFFQNIFIYSYGFWYYETKNTLFFIYTESYVSAS